MMTDQLTCKTCRYWQQGQVDHENNENDCGRCHIRSVLGSSFPLRLFTEWCGEHKPLKVKSYTPPEGVTFTPNADITDLSFPEGEALEAAYRKRQMVRGKPLKVCPGCYDDACEDCCPGGVWRKPIDHKPLKAEADTDWLDMPDVGLERLDEFNKLKAESYTPSELKRANDAARTAHEGLQEEFGKFKTEREARFGTEYRTDKPPAPWPWP